MRAQKENSVFANNIVTNTRLSFNQSSFCKGQTLGNIEWNLGLDSGVSKKGAYPTFSHKPKAYFSFCMFHLRTVVT